MALLDDLSQSATMSSAPQAAPGRPEGVGRQDSWSLQGLVAPMQDLVILATYSRSPRGEESIAVVGRSYRQTYLNAADGGGAVGTDALAVPPEHEAAAETKTLTIV